MKRRERGMAQQMPLLLTTDNDQFENTLMNHHNPHLSIDRQTTVHKSSPGKLLERRDSMVTNSALNPRRAGK